MKKLKNILVITLMVLVVFGATGCGKKKTENTKKAEDTSSKVVLNDTGFGKTTFKYDKSLDYTTKEETGGKYTEVFVRSESKGFELQLYHMDSYPNSYKVSQDNRKSSKEYKEYKWNKYEGYSFDGSKATISFNIKLSENKALFGELSSTKSDSNMTEVFTSKEFQDMLNSIVFEESK